MLGRFDVNGYVVVPRLLQALQVEEWTARLEALSGIARRDFSRRTALGARRRGLLGAWTLPDGVSRSREFWPLIFQERLLTSVRALLGEGARFLQHTDLHVGFSALGWHRDSVDRTLGRGGDWDEERAPYRILRVGVYLQSHESRFRLGVVPGSHRASGPPSRLESRRTAWASVFRNVMGWSNRAAVEADWLELAAGDCVIFDPRLLHSGSPIDGPKYSFFLAYGLPNHHFHRHRAYYRHQRPDLGYRELEPELVVQLDRAGLYAAEDAQQAEGTGGFQPGGLQTLLGKSVRFLGPRRASRGLHVPDTQP